MAAHNGVMRLVPYNANGIPLGEAHPCAKIPDAIVVRIRDLREYEHATIPEIARRLELNRHTVHAIVYYRRRRQAVADWREMPDRPETP